MARKSGGNKQVGSSYHMHKSFLNSLASVPSFKSLSESECQSKIVHLYAQDAYVSGKSLEEFVKTEDFVSMLIELDAVGGAPVIFPESLNLINKMNQAKFNFDKTVKLSLPFETFSLGMPKGLLCGDKELKSIMVRYDESGSSLTTGVNKLLAMVGKENEKNPHNGKAYNDGSLDSFFESSQHVDDEVTKDPYISIAVNYSSAGANKKTSFVEYTLRSELLSLALKSKDHNDFVSLVELYSKDRDVKNLRNTFSSSDTGPLLYLGIKTLASMAVYMSLDDNKLMQGMPSKHIKEKARLSQVNPNAESHFLKSTPAIENMKGDANPQGAHYRTFFFRNLRSEVYYKNQHKDKEIGSRWVPVSDALVKSNDDPHTLKM